ncbi:MAG TPA: hypothetical protein VGJ57_07745 [Nitrospirales bacterium]|jgi:hypothetical protein
MQHLAGFLFAIAAFVYAGEASAFEVMGCTFGPRDNPQDCINGKVNDRINQIQNDANQKIKDANQKAQEAQQRADAARRDVESGINFARLQGEQQLLRAARDLKLEPLMQCLAAAHTSGRADLSQYIQRFSANPGEFVKWMMDDLWRLAEADVDRLLAEELAELRKPTSKFRQNAPDPANSLAKLRRLAERHEGARCLLQYLDPRLPDLQRAAGELQAATTTRTMALFNQKVRPIIDDTMGRGMRAVMDATMKRGAARRAQPLPLPVGPLLPPAKGQIGTRDLDAHENPGQEVSPRGIGDVASGLKDLVPGPGDVKDIANGVFAEYLLNPKGVTNSADKIHLLALALSPANRTTMPRALADVRTAVDTNFQMPAVAYLDIGMEILRFTGNKFIDSEAPELDLGAGLAIPPGGGFIVNEAVSSLSTFEESVEKVAGAACGLIPEAGAAACNAVLWVANKGWEWVGRPAVKQAALAALHFTFNKFMDQAKEYVRANQGEDATRLLNTLRTEAGPMAVVVDSLQKDLVMLIAEDYVKDTKNALDRYNISVRELAEAAAVRP